MMPGSRQGWLCFALVAVLLAGAAHGEAATAATKSARFEIEGIHIGMTSTEITAALRTRGFVPADQGARHFRKEGAKPNLPGSPTIIVSYAGHAGPAARIEWKVRYASPQEGILGETYEGLVEKYGEPQKPRARIWVHKLDGWNETLGVGGSPIYVAVSLRAGIIDRAKFMALASSSGSVASSAGAQGGTETATKASEPAAEGAAAPRKAQFEIEGVRLGMASAQITAALRSKGFVPEDQRATRFKRQGAGPNQPGSPTITVSYLGSASQGAPAHRIEWRLRHSTSGSGALNARIYESLVERHGEPENPRFKRWMLDFHGWNETLTFQESSSYAAILLGAGVRDRAEFARLASPSGSVAGSSRLPETATAGFSAGDFDPLAVHGVRIGMELNDAKAALQSAGFGAMPGRECEFQKDRLIVKIGTGNDYHHCAEGEAVSFITYDGLQADGSLSELVKQAERHTGTKAKCRGLRDASLDCDWHSPPHAPLVRKINLRGSRKWLTLHLDAVKDLEAKASLPKRSAPSSEQPWWTRELAQADAAAQTAKFVGSERFDQLSPADKQRLGGEAATVYEYCKGRQLFSAFHDCRCVAGKFIDARLEKEEALTSPPAGQVPGNQGKALEDPLDRWRKRNDERAAARAARSADGSLRKDQLIAIADGVADQCPYKPGAANYAHKQCHNIYKTRLTDPADLKAFCNCYADTFAARYMQDPRAFVPNITGIGAAATLECTEKGYPSPLSR